VEHDVNIGQKGRQVAIPEVSLDELAVLEVGQGVPVLSLLHDVVIGREAVNGDDIVVISYEPIDEVAPYEARATCHERSH
jgi:hypothetical protein